MPHHRGAEEWLEPDEGRLSCPVLRGRQRRKTPPLPDRLQVTCALTNLFSARKHLLRETA